jgi:CHAD domain-containing protein
MAYKLKDREGIATGVRRIVSAELDKAIDELEGRRNSDPDAAVHEARKRCKKARAALRLVRDDLRNDLRRRENAALRDAQRRLSGVRDAHVMLETLDALRDEADGRVPASSVRGLRDQLRKRRDHARQGESGERAEAIAELTAARERIDGWPLSDESFGSAAQGLRRIYRDGRRAQHAALASAGPEHWHEWRKRVKDLWYAARILRPIAKVELEAVVDEADHLAELLGDHNDLAVLRRAVDDQAGDLTEAQADSIRAAIDESAAELRRRAVPLGLRLYAEKPKRFVARIAAYWEARPAQQAADAQWLEPETASRVRELLAARSGAPPDRARAARARVPRLGRRRSRLRVARRVRRGGLRCDDRRGNRAGPALRLSLVHGRRTASAARS